MNHRPCCIHGIGQATSKAADVAQTFNGLDVGEKVPRTGSDQALECFSSRSCPSKRSGRTKGAKVVLSGRRQAFEQGWIGATYGALKVAPLPVKPPHLGCTLLGFATEDQDVAEKAEGLHKVDLIRHFTSTLRPKLLDQVTRHDLGDFLTAVCKVTLELDEDLPGIAHSKHDARS